MTKKHGLRITALLLSVLMLAVSMPFATAANDDGTNYPYVFVHGMLGWGEGEGMYDAMPYWGCRNGNMLDSLRAQGYTCYSASVGKISSNWDRACELYAQLAGTVVDYGEAHSAAHNHSRYGRSYEGNALMPNFGGVDENGNLVKINLFGHSMGGPTVRLFTWMLANGSEEECAVSGEDVSDFFKGGKADYVYSVTTWSAPHNGTPASNVLYDELPTAYILALMGNFLGIVKADFWDFHLEQFGLTSVRSQGIKATLNPGGIKRLVTSDDNCGYDLSIRGAQALNDMIDIVDGVYYFSYTGEKVTEMADGTYKPNRDMFIIFPIVSRMIGKLDGDVYDGVALGKEWRLNDGIVPVISALSPFDEPSVNYEDVKDTGIEPGVWNVMPLIHDFCHTSYMGLDTNNFQYLFEDQMALINAL